MYDDSEFEANPELELAETLKHDLGKYVAWRSANLAEALWSGLPSTELLEALQADLLQTRTRPGLADAPEAAWDVWRRCMAQGGGKILLSTIDAAVETAKSRGQATHSAGAAAKETSPWRPSPELINCAELVAVAAAVERLALQEPWLRSGDLDQLARHRAQIRDDQRLIREQLRLLHRRLASAAHPTS